MTCIHCGDDAGYNRAVVDVVSGIELGGLCRDCEREEFGNSLARGDWACRDGCAFCDRDGYYALPLWEPYVVEEGDHLVNRVDYAVTDATVHFCDEHLHRIADDHATRADRRRRAARF